MGHLLAIWLTVSVSTRLMVLASAMPYPNDLCYRGYCAKGQFYRAADNQCIDCPKGQFMPQEGHQCKECKRCALPDVNLHTAVKENCTSTTDTVLGCSPDYHEAGREGFPIDCQKCTKCSPDETIFMKCVGKNDTVCIPKTNAELNKKVTPFTTTSEIITPPVTPEVMQNQSSDNNLPAENKTGDGNSISAETRPTPLDVDTRHENTLDVDMGVISLVVTVIGIIVLLLVKCIWTKIADSESKD